ncbi:hypothetical protein CVT24_009157 [Panaeolus cyanescens]|uniref:Uncharacterized protein n=1 Tax=Panaeolus cyanescens TaxID=181874 RepID=A0A409Y8Z9_9AGAR|nr:hypothetical protein CVT24_009157 [Panaeolus cyanescens]
MLIIKPLGASMVYVQGTLDNFSPAGTATYSVECSLEPSDAGGVMESIVTSARGNYTENVNNFCEGRNLSPSTTYTLNITLESFFGQPPYFDRLLIDPTPVFDLDKTTVIMDYRHIMIQYDSQWDAPPLGLRVTNKTGAKMSLDFTGTSVQWYSYWHRELASGSAEASWRIDDSPFQTFSIPAISPDILATVNDNPPPYIQDLLFKTPDFPFGEHRLEVVHGGPESSRPLVLDHLVIQKSPQTTLNPSPSPSTRAGSIPSDQSTPTNNESNDLSQSAKIAIGVSTSISALIVCIALVFFLFRRRRGSKPEEQLKTVDSEAEQEAPQDSTTISPYQRPESMPRLEHITPAAPDSKGTPITPLLSPYPYEPISSTLSPVVSHSTSSEFQPDSPPPYHNLTHSLSPNCLPQDAPSLSTSDTSNRKNA